MKTLWLFLACLLCASPFAGAQTKTVLKGAGNNALTENLVVPSGRTLTISAGGSIINNGTATGFASGGAGVWGSITGTLSAQTDLASALNARAPLASPTFTGTVTIPSGASIAGYLTTTAAAATYQPLDADLTGVAALATTSFGRSLLTLTTADSLAETAGLGQNDGVQFNTVTTSGGFIGAGTDLTDLTASNITIGTLDDARLSANVSLLGSSISLTSEVSGTLPIANGGTGQATASAARVALLPSMTGHAGKFLQVNGTGTDVAWAAISGGGDALTANPLSQFAPTTSAQLRSVLTDESGSGEILTTNGSAANLTSFPTLNQSTTGNAATATALQTARNINGVSFNGTADITVPAAAGTLTGTTLASGVTSSSLTSVGTISSGVWQGSAIQDSYIASAATWNAKESALTFSTGLTRSVNTITVNSTQSISKLSNLTSNGLVTTSGGDGTLSVDTTTKSRADSLEIVVACSDETTAVTTGTAKVTFRLPCAMTLTSVRASLTTAPSGSAFVCDINEGGVSVLGTKLSVDADEKTSTTAASAATITDSSLADDAEITIDFDSVGVATAGAGVKVTLKGTRN